MFSLNYFSVKQLTLERSHPEVEAGKLARQQPEQESLRL